jgi:predicted DNA-binding protein
MHEKNNGFSIELDETHLNEIEDVYNSNIEVFVTLQDGLSLTIVVGTSKNLQYLMEKDKVNFYGPGLPWIIVQKLTKGIIQEAIEAYIDDKADGYWLKLYHFAPDIDIAIFNQLQAQKIAKFAQFKLLIGLDDLKAKINKLDNLDKSKKSDLIASLDKLYKDLKNY